MAFLLAQQLLGEGASLNAEGDLSFTGWLDSEASAQVHTFACVLAGDMSCGLNEENARESYNLIEEGIRAEATARGLL